MVIGIVPKALNMTQKSVVVGVGTASGVLVRVHPVRVPHRVLLHEASEGRAVGQGAEPVHESL